MELLEANSVLFTTIHSQSDTHLLRYMPFQKQSYFVVLQEVESVRASSHFPQGADVC